MGRSQVVKAPVFGTGIRRFESSRPSHTRERAPFMGLLSVLPVNESCGFAEWGEAFRAPIVVRIEGAGYRHRVHADCPVETGASPLTRH